MNEIIIKLKLKNLYLAYISVNTLDTEIDILVKLIIKLHNKYNKNNINLDNMD